MLKDFLSTKITKVSKDIHSVNDALSKNKNVTGSVSLQRLFYILCTGITQQMDMTLMAKLSNSD